MVYSFDYTTYLMRFISHLSTHFRFWLKLEASIDHRSADIVTRLRTGRSGFESRRRH